MRVTVLIGVARVSSGASQSPRAIAIHYRRARHKIQPTVRPAYVRWSVCVCLFVCQNSYTASCAKTAHALWPRTHFQW